MRTLKPKHVEKRLTNYVWNKLFISANEKYFLSYLLRFTDIIIFGGVIREFILNNLKKIEHRDIDIVLEHLDDRIKNYISKFLIKKNSFGGYKLRLGQKDIDLWELETTWGIKNKSPLFYNSIEFLPETSFFNMNAVAFSIKTNKLIYTEGFEKFLKERVLDIEFRPNPLPELCLLKTYEYYKKYNVKISDNLREFITDKIKTSDIKYLYDIQNKHYGLPKFSTKELMHFYQTKIIFKEKYQETLFQLN